MTIQVLNCVNCGARFHTMRDICPRCYVTRPKHIPWHGSQRQLEAREFVDKVWESWTTGDNPLQRVRERSLKNGGLSKCF